MIALMVDDADEHGALVFRANGCAVVWLTITVTMASGKRAVGRASAQWCMRMATSTRATSTTDDWTAVFVSTSGMHPALLRLGLKHQCVGAARGESGGGREEKTKRKGRKENERKGYGEEKGREGKERHVCTASLKRGVGVWCAVTREQYRSRRCSHVQQRPSRAVGRTRGHCR